MRKNIVGSKCWLVTCYELHTNSKAVFKKGVKKLKKWLFFADIFLLIISVSGGAVCDNDLDLCV